MFFKKIKPVSPSLRDKLVVKRPKIRKFFKLFLYNNRSQGRSNYGGITSYCKGGGNLFQYRFVDYNNFSFKIPGIFLGYDFDNYRTGWIGLIKYINGCYGYILAASNMSIGSIVQTCPLSYNYNIGSRFQLLNVSTGLWIYNVEISSLKGGKISRAAGTGCYFRTFDKKRNIAILRLPSRKIKEVSGYCFASIGKVSNEFHFLEHFSKAGVCQIFNYRPSVRGEAMNAVDHHHGGKTKGGKKPKTPWGKIVKK